MLQQYDEVLVKSNWKKRNLTVAISLAGLLSGFVSPCFSRLEPGPSKADLPKLNRELDSAKRSGNKSEQAKLLYAIGDLEEQKGNTEKAVQLIRESLTLEDEIATVPKKADVFFAPVHTRIALAELLIKLGRAEEALKLYEEAADKAEKANLTAESAKVYKQLGSVFLLTKQFDRANTYFLKAKDIAEKGSFNDTLVAVLTDMASSARYRRNFDEALGYLKQASMIQDDAIDEIDQGRVLNELGRTYSDMELNDQAMEYYDKARKLYEESAEPVASAEVLVSMAELDLLERRSDQALTRLQTALSSLENESSAKLQARCLTRLGSALADSGKIEEAIANHKKAEKLAQKAGSAEEECLAITEQGYDNLLEGKSERALQHFLRAQKFIEKSQSLSKTERADVLKYCAMGYRNVGQAKTAIKYYLEASKMYADSKKLLEQALVLDSVAVAYLDQGNSELFEKYHNEAKSLFDSMSTKGSGKADSRARATMSYNYGQYCVLKSQYADAIEAYEKAIEASRSAGDTLGHCQALRGLGLTYYLLGQNQKSQENYQAASALADKLSNLESQWDCAAGLGKVYLKMGDHQQAEKMLMKAISLADKERVSLSRDSFKTAALDLREDCFFDLVELLIKDKRYEQALEIAEKGRARAFLDMLEGRKQTSYGQRQVAALPLDVTPVLEEKKEEAPVQIAMATVPQGGFRAVTVSPRAIPTVETTVLSAANAKPPTLAEIKQLVKETKTWVVEYLAMPDKIIAWIIKPDGEVADVKVIPAKINDVKDLVREAHRTITSAPKAVDELHALNKKRESNLKALHKLLFEPLEAALPKDENQVITIVPHGSLFSVPFSALMSANGKFLIEQHTLAYLPAIGVLRATNAIDRGIKSEKDSLLAFGNPITERNKDLGKLPYAEKEVKKVSALFPAGTSAIEVGGAATKAKFREMAPKYSYIHLATHGLVDQEHPMESAVVLAPEGGDDGLLTVKEILQLPQLKAKMIVLSACQTGQGKITGDGVVGLSRAFVIAGTPSVLVSLWSVDDVMTEYQMEALYFELLKGANKAQALRKAQLRTINFMEKGLASSRDDDDDKPVAANIDRANPRYWAAFQLLGEYN